MTFLRLHGNQISDISALTGLTNLTFLTLASNQISDISAPVNNPGLGSGDRVNLLDLSDNSDDMNNIQTLISRGVEVYY